MLSRNQEPIKIEYDTKSLFVDTKKKDKESHSDLEIEFSGRYVDNCPVKFSLYEFIKEAKGKISINRVIKFKATGKALGYIKEQYFIKRNVFSIPMNGINENEMTWHGDIAKTILENL